MPSRAADSSAAVLAQGRLQSGVAVYGSKRGIASRRVRLLPGRV
jgi:hypothetical protein